jgi:uncharacterized OB-fold protein
MAKKMKKQPKKEKISDQEFVKQIEQLEESKDFHEYPDQMCINYIYSTGELSKFFKEIRDNERLFGTRCTKCGFGYFPPRIYCGKCYAPCEWEEISSKGQIVTGTITHFAVSTFTNRPKTTIAFIKMDDMDQLIRHTVIMNDEDCILENVKQGTRVKVKFKPKEEREGKITDFYFVLDK